MTTHTAPAPPGDVTAEDLDRTSRDLNRGVWGVASILMVGSAVGAGYAVHYLGEFWGVGVLEAAGIDGTLLTWLKLRRRLMDADVTTLSGRVLEGTAMLMTLYLNGGAAIFRAVNQNSTDALVLLMVAHWFVPIIFTILLVAGGEARHQLTRITRARDAQRQAARDAETARRDAAALLQQHERDARLLSQARSELVAAEDYTRKTRELRAEADRVRQAALQEMQQADADRATAAATKLATEQELAATKLATARLLQARQEHTQAGPPASRQERIEWVRAYFRERGELPRPCEVDAHFGGTTRTGSAIVAKVRKEMEQNRVLRVVGDRS